MRLLLYYISHTFINSIKKLFRTWVAIFFALMIAFGAILGLGAIVFSEHVIGNEVQNEEVAEHVEDVEEGGEHDKPLQEVFDELAGEEKVFVCRIIADIVFVLSLGTLLFSIYCARKGGTEIFTMADVNFLFTAPMKPQSVLLFKTVLQMGLILAGSIYFVLQIPNLVMNMGLSWEHIVLIFVLSLILLITNKLASILVYTVTATYTSLRKYIHPFVYSVVLLVVATCAFSRHLFYEDFFTTVYHIFSAKYALAIPFVGWTAGLIYSFLMKEYVTGIIYGILILAGFGGVIYLIWKMEADFYEDALTNANTMQEKVEAAKTGIQVNGNRPKRLRRDGEIGKGEGANTFFYKNMHNRRRMAYLGIVTNSMLVYSGIVLVMGWVNQMLDGDLSIHVVGAMLLAVMFFKSYVSPMMEECKQNFIYLVPEKPSHKIFNLLMAEMTEILLDLIPAMLLMKVFLHGSILKIVLWTLVIVSFAFILTSVSLFIDMILPESLPTEIQTIFMIFGKFAGVLPMGIVVIVLAILDMLPIAFFLSLLCNVFLGVVFTGISSALLHVGSK